MSKINWKAIGSVALNVGKQLFPVIGIVEDLAKLKGLSSKEKQNLAFKALHDDLIKDLLPAAASDPRLEQMIRRLIDDGVELNNLIAELKQTSPSNQ
jgi:hypothetical protein